MKALKSLLTNRYSTCKMEVCGLKVLPDQDQFKKIQKWHSMDLKLEDQESLKLFHNLIANLLSTKM